MILMMKNLITSAEETIHAGKLSLIPSMTTHILRFALYGCAMGGQSKSLLSWPLLVDIA